MHPTLTPIRALAARSCRTGVRAAIAAVATAGLIATTAGMAAAGAPGFMRLRDLPRGHSWSAEGIQQGVPGGSEFCLGLTIPADFTLYQRYHDDLDASVIEYIHTSTSEADAIAFAKKEKHRIKTCATRWDQHNPDGSSEFESYGSQPVDDGVSSFGVFVYPPQADPSANLFAVGRDGNTVAVVRFGQIGTAGDADVDDFLRTARLATERMLLN